NRQVTLLQRPLRFGIERPVRLLRALIDFTAVGQEEHQRIHLLGGSLRRSADHLQDLVRLTALLAPERDAVCRAGLRVEGVLTGAAMRGRRGIEDRVYFPTAGTDRPGLRLFVGVGVGGEDPLAEQPCLAVAGGTAQRFYPERIENIGGR